jgi:Holliday junction resolvasome RuvABC ATP-dependent DNA helicase subunit
VIDFIFENNITILMGDSGTGKSASYSFIKECMSMNPDILCINYLDYQKDIGEMIKSVTGKLIVIDNADVLLSDNIRKYIALDDKNQYLIIGRNPKNLFTTKENLYELTSRKEDDQTVLGLKSYL